MPAVPAPHAVPDELELERDHLARSRADLARMRERTAALDSSAAGDWVSQQVLESTMFARMKALEDDPTVPLFFGRLDYEADHVERGASFHIGRRHVTDDGGEPMVVDWRAPISLPFYRASSREPMGVRLRRRFGFQQGRITAFEDERLGEGGGQEYSRLLEEEIERPRVGPMRDIVATIQPEQDVIVRADLATSVCVQGAPGTGKTAVGLHRAAYLLYAFRDQLARQGVLVVGPNASFLSYIGDVLPALGEITAEQTTVAGLVEATLTRADARHAVRGEDPADVATLKGDARMAEVLRRAVWGHLTPPTEGLVVPRGASRWRIPAYEVEEMLDELRGRGVRYAAARAMLGQRLAHAVLVRMEDAGEVPDDRVQDAVARSRPVKAYVDACWPALAADRLVHRLLTDRAFLRAAADGLLDEDEQRALCWPRPPRSARAAPWSVADAVLVDEAADLLERTPSRGHLVLDEAQDLSPMMLRAVGRRSTTGSVTVLGDLAQATTPWATGSWEEALGHLGKPDAHVEELTQGFRVPGEVIHLAARLLPVISPALRPPTSVRRTRGDLELVPVADAVAAAVSAAAVERVGSTGVVVPDGSVDALTAALTDQGVAHGVLGRGDPIERRDPVDVVPASLAKGLEFDHVVLADPEGIVSSQAERRTGLRLLYVCLTRAVTSLVVLHDTALPPELAGARPSR
jgi:DNA helicase IV